MKEGGVWRGGGCQFHFYIWHVIAAFKMKLWYYLWVLRFISATVWEKNSFTCISHVAHAHTHTHSLSLPPSLSLLQRKENWSSDKTISSNYSGWLDFARNACCLLFLTYVDVCNFYEVKKKKKEKKRHLSKEEEKLSSMTSSFWNSGTFITQIGEEAEIS